MKCKPYSEITVEIWTQLKTVRITSNIFAVWSCLSYLYGGAPAHLCLINFEQLGSRSLDHWLASLLHKNITVHMYII